MYNLDRAESHLYSGHNLLSYSVLCPGFQKGRVPSEKGTLARWTDRQKDTLAWWTEEKGHN